MLRALDEYVIEGVRTTIPALRMLLENDQFVDGSYSTTTVEGGALDGLTELAEDPSVASNLVRVSSVSGDGPAAAEREIASQDPLAADGDAVLLIGSAAVRLWNPAISASVSGASALRGRAPGAAVASRGRATPSGSAPTAATRGAILAPMHGTILSLGVKVGDQVEAGSSVAILEAMKMETTLTAPVAGTVDEVRTGVGSVVQSGDVVAVVRPG
jgi:biotin carboxyl carrier protein